MKMKVWIVWLAGLFTLLFGCEGPRIAVPPARAAGSTGAISLSKRPWLTIGAVEGKADQLFSEIKGAFRLPSGEFVIANSYPPELRIFSPGGDPKLSIGGQGDGPGEFRSIAWVKHAGGDTIIVFDQGHVRLTSVTSHGMVLSVTALPANRFGGGSAFTLLDVLPGGTTGLARNAFLFPPSAKGPGRSQGMLVLADLTTGVVVPLLKYPDAEYATRENSTRTTAVLFGSVASIANTKDHVYVADGSRFVVQMFDMAGRNKQTFSTSHLGRRVTPDDVAAERQRFLDDAPITDREIYLAELKREFNDVPVAAVRPALGGYMRRDEPAKALFIDIKGHLWALQHVTARDTLAHWTVFSKEGGAIATVSVPRGFWPTEAGLDYLMGIHRDQVGVETVQVYRLTRSISGGQD